MRERRRGVFFVLAVEAEAAGEEVRDEERTGYLVVADECGGDEGFLHVNAIFRAAAGEAWAWPRVGLLREMYGVPIGLRMLDGAAGEEMRGGFGAHHAEVIEPVAMDGVRKDGVEGLTLSSFRKRRKEKAERPICISNCDRYIYISARGSVC
jgi:hypothetical protein